MTEHLAIRINSSQSISWDTFDGNMKPIMGTKHFQVKRARRAEEDVEEGPGWTFQNAPMLTFWKERFYLSYISCPKGENTPPCRTMLTTSANGRDWSAPVILFPNYDLTDCSQTVLADSAVMHHRMGFYIAPNGRLLALGFYGISPEPATMPNDGGGIGRVVREIYEDGRLGDIFFIRYNRHAGWNEDNTQFPFYLGSGDAGFIGACEACLQDKLVTQQWWEEDRSEDGFYSIKDLKAMSAYPIGESTTAAVWKTGKHAFSHNGGESWTCVQPIEGMVTAGNKIWGQRLSDGTYALIYSSSPVNERRWPLVMATSSDGLTFTSTLLVRGDVPLRRYEGYYKFFGLNYVRGLEGGACLDDLWLTYSVNKEDIWVTTIPVPFLHGESADVDDCFYSGDADEDERLRRWNLYSSVYSNVRMDRDPVTFRQCLTLRDKEYFDYAKAERYFEPGAVVTISFDMLLIASPEGRLACEVMDNRNSPIVSVFLIGNGGISVQSGQGAIHAGHYKNRYWHRFCLRIDGPQSVYSLRIDDDLLHEGRLARNDHIAERITFRTDAVPQSLSPVMEQPDAEGAERLKAESVYCLASLRAVKQNALKDV